MNWEDDDFERDVMSYSEIEILGPQDTEPVPRTIQRYQQTILSNNTASIFDADYSFPATSSTPSSFEDVSRNNCEGILKDDDQVIRVISGRGRGGRNVFHRPGDPNKTKLLDDDQEVIQQLRKVAPLGYGNEITENAVRNHHKTRLIEKEKSAQSSPSASKSNSRDGTPVDLKKDSACESSSSPSLRQIKSPAIYLSASEVSSPSRTSDIESPHLVESPESPHGSLNLKEIDSESEVILADNDDTSNQQETKNTPAVTKPLPMSEIIRHNREDYKKRQLERQRNQTSAAYPVQNGNNKVATKRNILGQINLSEQSRRIQLVDSSSYSNVRTSNASPSEDILPWRQRGNSPPRASWGQRFKKNDSLNISSNQDFPPLGEKHYSLK